MKSISHTNIIIAFALFFAMGHSAKADDLDKQGETTVTTSSMQTGETRLLPPPGVYSLKYTYDSAGNRVGQRYMEPFIGPIISGYQKKELPNIDGAVASIVSPIVRQNTSEVQKEVRDES